MRTNLQAMRKRAGFSSAREFAEHMGINVKTYTNYEQGVSSMTLERAWEFADVLNCSLDELAGREYHADGTRPSDPLSAEMFDLFPQLTTDRKRRLVETARDGAEMSKETAERDIGVAESVA